MSLTPCPKCGTPCEKGGYRGWQILVAIFLFPIGLLALASGRKDSTCFSCGTKW
jgi:hypothetical protein